MQTDAFRYKAIRSNLKIDQKNCDTTTNSYDYIRLLSFAMVSIDQKNGNTQNRKLKTAEQTGVYIQ